MKVELTDRLLMSVEKPARYTGGEWNSVIKEGSGIKARFAFCFPDVYEIGMSHLGMKILYHLINDQPAYVCERVFAPWVDMESKMREENIPLFSLETRTCVRDFDLIGFTLQYEMSYTNILNMLDMAGVPVRSADRGEGIPFVCAGGPCAVNPEPLADFIDFFMIGEGEEVILEVMDAYTQWKASGENREAFLLRVAQLEGVYVPRFYDAAYNEDGTLASIRPNRQGVPAQVRRRIILDMDKAYYPERFVVPYTGIVHDRAMLELFRGCTRGCRFCQAGVIYRPVRERSPERLKELAGKLIDNTGYDEISLTSLSTSDYSGFEVLASGLMEEMARRRVNLALPSLRIDSFSIDLMEKVQKVRKSGLTFAPEAGSQRLRDVINKGITEEDVMRSCALAFEGGWSSVKLYFMMGLPTETDEDLLGISDLATKVVNCWHKTPREKRGKGLHVTASVSCFVPKPFTPFQWDPQDTMETFREKQQLLRNVIRNRSISYNYHDAHVSLMEAVLSRGDRRIGNVIYTAWKAGGRFDSWNEFYSLDRWQKAMEECGLEISFYAHRRRPYTEVLPWSIIDVGVDTGFLMAESERARRGELTPDCVSHCSGCGAATYGGGVCFG